MDIDQRRFNSKSKTSRDVRALTGLRKYRIMKKRKTPINCHGCEKDDSFVSPPSKKLETFCQLESAINNDIDYVLLNFVSVFSFISEHVECKDCGNNVTFAKSLTRGLGFKIQILCLYCEPRSVSSCPYISDSYEINTRFIFAMQMIGVGYKGAKRFCGIMDLAPPVVLSIYNSIVKHILCASQSICDMISRAVVHNDSRTTAGATVQSNEEFAVFGDEFDSNITKLAANIAKCIFNFGSKSYLQVMDVLGIKVGRNADRYCDDEDAERIYEANVGVHQVTRDGENQHRQSRIAFENAASAAEALFYELGITE